MQTDFVTIFRCNCQREIPKYFLICYTIVFTFCYFNQCLRLVITTAFKTHLFNSSYTSCH